MLSAQQPRQRDLLHVVVAGRRLRRSTSSRGSGANARNAADGCLQIARARTTIAMRLAASARRTVSRVHRRPASRARRDRGGRVGSSRSTAPRRSPSRPAARSARAEPSASDAPPASVEQIGEREAGERHVVAASARAARDRGDARRRATPACRRCGTRPPTMRAGSAAGDASTWTSNTRTNVVRAAVQPAPHVVGPHADRDQIVAVEHRRASSSIAIASPIRSPSRRRASSCLPSLVESAPRSLRAFARPRRRRDDARRPGPREAFRRPLARRVDAHLAAVRRQIRRIVEIVDRPRVIWMSRSGSMCVPTIHATSLTFVHVDVLVDDDDGLREHQLAEPPERVHDLARVARDSACRSRRARGCGRCPRPESACRRSPAASCGSAAGRSARSPCPR